MNQNKYNGFLNIYKEPGMTSMAVCAKLRKVLGMRKIGHAGTLDPMAEGVLPVALGLACKDTARVGDGTKEYRAVMLLGTETDTEDITGEVTARHGGELPSPDAVKDAVMSFKGDYEQLTPMYSARKVAGKRLYEYARKGIEVERKTQKVSIFDISVEKIELPYVTFTACVSKGTYIRSLCRDIGVRLGCGACMSSLTRTRVGNYRIADALRIDEVKKTADAGELDSVLRVEAPTAISLGKFDGAHIGHQALLKELRKTAEQGHLRSMALVLKFGRDKIMSDEECRERLYGFGIDYCIGLDFTEEMKAMSAEDFLRDVLIGRYNMKTIVAGTDVSFGKGKAGNAKFLKEHADEYGYRVKLIEKVKTAEDESCETVSSTLLRSCLKRGEMEKVTGLLGVPFTISGKVVHGRGIATGTMNYPTMNIEVPDGIILPPLGVYAVEAGIEQGDGREQQRVCGIANLGERPTAGGPEDGMTRIRLEIHAFSEIGDCYGLTVHAGLIHFIRPERKFDSFDELMRQIEGSDIGEARRALGLSVVQE